VAEKVHAYTRTYSDGLGSTRVKDLVDLVLVKSLSSLKADRQRQNLVRTFEGRALHPLPDALPMPPPDWAPAYRRLATEVGLDPDLRVGHAEAAVLIDPVLAGRTRGRWSPKRSTWIDEKST